MGKEKRAPAAKVPKKPPPIDYVPPPWAVTAAGISVMLLAAWAAGQATFLRSEAEGDRCTFLVRLLFYFTFDAALSRNCALLLLVPARALARRLPGAVVRRRSSPSRG